MSHLNYFVDLQYIVMFFFGFQVSAIISKYWMILWSIAFVPSSGWISSVPRTAWSHDRRASHHQSRIWNAWSSHFPGGWSWMPTAIHAGLSCRFEASGVHLMDMDKPQAQLVQEFNDQQCDKLMLNVNQPWVSTIDYQHLSTGFQMASIVNNNDQRPTTTTSSTTTTTTNKNKNNNPKNREARISDDSWWFTGTKAWKQQ